MKPLNNSLFDKLKQKAFDRFSKGLGSMLIVTSALGWVLGSAGQIFGVMTNDKYSSKDKNFLVRQEIADGLLNIIAFCAITISSKNFSKKLVDTGKIISPKIAEFCKKNGIDLSKDKINIPDALKEKITNITKKIENGAKVLNQGETSKLEAEKNALLEFKKDVLAPFQSGAEVFGTLAGGILASNIVTPILRNKIAASSLKKQNIQQNQTQTQYQQLPYQRTYPTQSGMKI